MYLQGMSILMESPHILELLYEMSCNSPYSQKCSGQDVFNLACVTFGIRETWYFGLQFNDTSATGDSSGGVGNGGSWWLRPDRRLSEVVRSLPAGSPLHFLFHVRFWVEDVGEDLLLEATVHLFYLEVKDLVLTRQQWAASPDLLPLLAAYAAQAELGDHDPAVSCENLLGRLLPGQAQQPEAAAQAEKLRDHYKDLAGLGRTEAELEMLRLAQDLEMFGLVYFPIHANGPASEPASWLGISCFGVSFFEQASLVKPSRRLAWSEIRRMYCRDRKFTLIVNDAPSASSAGSSDEPPTCFGVEHRGGRAVSFWTKSSADSKQILRLCVGNHELYAARRMPDTIERQQMRATAREERARRQQDKQRLAREVECRAAAERLRGAAEEKAGQLGQLLAKSEAMLGLLSERARLAEDEMRLLSEQRDRQLAHMRHIHAQLLSEKQNLAERARQFESLLLTLSEEASVNEAERDCLRQQLAYARQGERSLLAKLEALLRSVGVWSSAGGSDSSADLAGAPPPESESEETSGLSTAELLARLQAERQLFADGSAAFEADLRQLRSRVQATRLGGAATAAVVASAGDPGLVTHSTAVSCPLQLRMAKAGKAKQRQRTLSSGLLESPPGGPSCAVAAPARLSNEDPDCWVPGWVSCLATICQWTVGLALMLSCAFGFAWLTNETHEATLFFSNIKQVEREISLRTEQGLYYSYYKQLVHAPTLRRGLAQLLWNNATEHPDTINVLQRMNVYQELLLGLMYRYTWFRTLLEPIYFYLYFVLFLNSLLICGLFSTTWYLTGTPLAGCLSAVMYTLNSAHTTRLSNTHSLREHFSLPFLWLQIFCLTVYFSKNSVRGTLRERASLLGAQICCFLFTLFWQFNQFVLLLQALSVLAGCAIGFVQFRKAFAFLMTAAGSLLSVSLLQFFNPMLLSAPALSVCLSGALSIVVSRRWLLPGFGLGSWLAKVSRIACQVWVVLLSFAVLQTALKLLVRHDADSHIYKFVMMKLGFGYDDDFDVRMYNCAGAFIWLPWSTFSDLAGTRLLQPYLVVHAALYLLTLLGFLDYVWRKPAEDASADADEDASGATGDGGCGVAGGQVDSAGAGVWRDVMDSYAQHPELAYHAIQCTVFAILGFTTLRMKYFWTPYMCILMPLALGHRRCWDWLLRRLLRLRLRHAGFAWTQILTLALLASATKTCYQENKANLENLREFWDPDTVQLMEWISSSTPPDAAFTGSMQLLAGVKCCTERHITNHPHYEDQRLREKTRQLYQIYGRKPPEEVHRILRSYGSDYIILEDSICLRQENGCGTTELVDNLNGELTNLQASLPQPPPALRRSTSPRFCDEIRRSHGLPPGDKNPYAKLFRLVLENRTFRVYKLL